MRPHIMKYLALLCIIVLCGSVTMAGAVSSVPAQKNKVIGVIIETSAQRSGKIHYSDIVSYDSSNKQISGPLVMKNGDLVRKCTAVKNNLSWYALNSKTNQTVILDPCMTQSTHIPLINIVSSLDAFHTPAQKKVKEFKPTNDTKATTIIREWSKDRSMDQHCTNGIISSVNWRVLLPDTITLMQHNCDYNYTKVQTNYTEPIKLVKHDISTSYKAKDEKWKKEIAQNCLQKRNSCTELKQPTRGGYESKVPANVILNNTRNK